MRQTITKCYCDLCMQEVEEKQLNHAVMPRNVIVWAKGGHNDTKLASWTTVHMMPVDLCDKCCKIVATCLPTVDEEEDTGYMD